MRIRPEKLPRAGGVTWIALALISLSPPASSADEVPPARRPSWRGAVGSRSVAGGDDPAGGSAAPSIDSKAELAEVGRSTPLDPARRFFCAAAPRAKGAPRRPGAGGRYLEKITKELLAGCRIRAENGTVLYTPDGHGHYRALWTRDFAYMVENAGYLIPAEHVEACLELLLGAVRADGAAPDRVRPDGEAVYAAGAKGHPVGEPNIDNAQFLAITVDEHLRRVPRPRARALFARWAPVLDRAMDWIPRAPSGLVWNDPDKPHSPYGFTDTIAKTGELFMESVLYWTACRRLERRNRDVKRSARALEYGDRAAAIERAVGRLWDEDAGAFLAATRDCRQLDIWGNAYALRAGLPLGERRARVLGFLARNVDRFTQRGQVRHLLEGEHWERLLIPIAPDRYQNGAYWATASGWVIEALAESDRALARRLAGDLLRDFREHGVHECVHGDDYRKLDRYVVSATNPLGALRRLGF